MPKVWPSISEKSLFLRRFLHDIAARYPFSGQGLLEAAETRQSSRQLDQVGQSSRKLCEVRGCRTVSDTQLRLRRTLSILTRTTAVLE